MRTILIDDLRNIQADVTCRTAAAAYPILESQSFDCYYFDHDLGSTKPGTSGYDILKWALMNEYIPVGAVVHLVTMNPVGNQNMKNQLLSFGFDQIGSGNTFERIT